MLLDNKANVKVTESHSATPLRIAAQHGHVDLFKLLTDHDADVNAIDDNGETPAFTAISNNYISVLKILLDHKTDVNARRTKSGASLMHISAESGNAEITSLLLSRNADADVADKTDLTMQFMKVI